MTIDLLIDFLRSALEMTFEIVVYAAFLAALPFFAKMLRELFSFLRLKTMETRNQVDDQIITFIEYLSVMVVRAVEQEAVKGYIVNEAAAKKAAAVKRLESHLMRIGVVNPPTQLVSDAIEAAIRQRLHKMDTQITVIDEQGGNSGRDWDIYLGGDKR